MRPAGFAAGNVTARKTEGSQLQLASMRPAGFAAGNAEVAMSLLRGPYLLQ